MEVLDIGCGAGLMPLMAARKARQLGQHKHVHVTAVDRCAHLLECAADIAVANDLGATLTLVHKDSRRMVVGEDMPRRCDLLVLELFDYGLIGEGLLIILAHAFHKLLSPTALVIPAAARTWGALVQMRVERAAGFDVELWNTYRFSPDYTGVDLRARHSPARPRHHHRPFVHAPWHSTIASRRCANIAQH